AGGPRGGGGHDQRRGGDALGDRRALPPEDRLHRARAARPPRDPGGLRAPRQTAAGGPGAGAEHALLSETDAVHDIGKTLVVDGARVAELRGGDIEIVDLGPGASGAWRASVVRAVVVNGAVEIDGRRAPAFRLRSEGPIRLNGREYPAPLDIVRSGEGLAVVNEVPLEDYVVGVLRAEAHEKWPLEMLRAQAVVARTYAAHHRNIAAG